MITRYFRETLSCFRNIPFFKRILVIEKSEVAKLIIQLVVVVDLRFDNEARLLVLVTQKLRAISIKLCFNHQTIVIVIEKKPSNKQERSLK